MIVPCRNCAHDVSSTSSGHMPPWCPHCGAAFDKSLPKQVPAPQAQNEPVGTTAPLRAGHYTEAPTFSETAAQHRGTGSPLGIKATAWVRCWKQHTCAACGSIYRYKFEQAARASGSVASLARQKAEQQLLLKVAWDCEPRPCPECGLIQPDMAAKSKILWHSLCTILVLLGSAAVISAACGETMPLDRAGMIMAGMAGVAALGHLVAALRNLNSNRSANQEKTLAHVAAGGVEVVKPGAGNDVGDLPPNLSARHGLALLGVIAAVPAFLALEFTQPEGGWPLNRDLKPYVLAPGDNVRIYADEEIKSVRGIWRGVPKVQLLNADELGGPLTLVASCRNDDWDDEIQVEAYFDSGLLVHPDLLLTIPDNPAVAGKTLRVRMNMSVTYPGLKDAKNLWMETYEERTTTVTKELNIHVASLEVKRGYWAAWSIGIAVGVLGSVLGGFGLVGLALSLRSKAMPSEAIALRS